VPVKILDLKAWDLRFPTSQGRHGSDAMNPDPDYSAAYVVLEAEGALQGHGLAFTIGRGNDLVVQAIRELGRFLQGISLETFKADPLRVLAHPHCG
jgi:L-fuconate dehydratase